MPRPTSRAQLLETGEANFDKLLAFVITAALQVVTFDAAFASLPNVQPVVLGSHCSTWKL
jgi:hypothetical protein